MTCRGAFESRLSEALVVDLAAEDTARLVELAGLLAIGQQTAEQTAQQCNQRLRLAVAEFRARDGAPGTSCLDGVALEFRITKMHALGHAAASRQMAAWTPGTPFPRTVSDADLMWIRGELGMGRDEKFTSSDIRAVRTGYAMRLKEAGR